MKIDVPKGMCVEEVTGMLKTHINTGKYIIKSYKVVEVKEDEM